MNPYRDTIKIETEFCAICIYEGVRNEFEIMWKESGKLCGKIVDYKRCKDHKACAERCSKVDWSKIGAASQ